VAGRVRTAPDPAERPGYCGDGGRRHSAGWPAAGDAQARHYRQGRGI